jgi:hypothetical protein
LTVLWAIVITLGATAIAIAVLLVVRRHAPDGGFFHDGDRAAGLFGMVGAGFAITVGFVVFLAFESFDQSRAGAETEAILVAQQFETAQLLPPASRAALSGELVCYGRYVVHQAWPRLEEGKGDQLFNPWGIALFRTLQRINPTTPAEQAAYSKWLDQTSDREQARQDRIHGAEGVIPSPVWIVLFFGAAAIFVFVMFFADSGEPAVVQALQIGTVVAVVSATLAVIGFLNHPFQSGLGGLRPVAMERSLEIMGRGRAIVGQSAALPCDERGTARER